MQNQQRKNRVPAETLVRMPFAEVPGLPEARSMWWNTQHTGGQAAAGGATARKEALPDEAHE